MARVPVRKRLKVVKKGRRRPVTSLQSPPSVSDSDASKHADNSSLGGSSVADTVLNSFEPNSPDSAVQLEPICDTTPVMRPAICPDLSVLQEMKKKLDFFLWTNWISVLESDGVSVICLSRDRPRTAQRNVYFHYSGSVALNVHNQECDAAPFLKDFAPVYLTENSIGEFIDRSISIVSEIRLMEICAGVDNEIYESVRDKCPGGSHDKNPYREMRYVETFRSNRCKYLVSSRTWRCTDCCRMLRPLKAKLQAAAQEKRHSNTPNICLTEEQKLQKLKQQRKELDSAKKKIQDLHKKVQALVKKEGVRVDDSLNNDLMSLMKSADLTQAQEIFLHQQVKASQGKKQCGMRWHPTMIRFALSIHLTSPAAYQLLRDTGMVKLPSSRTLFDYSHVKPTTEGIDNHVIELESVVKRLKDVNQHQQYHVLLADEMYISKNLVYQKSSGRLIGYTNLDQADREVRALNDYLDDPNSFDGNPAEQIADKVMCYMIKGTSFGIKEVVASFAVASMSANQMYLWTWRVIGALERNGIKVVSFVCDGSTTNRAFINLHTPVTKLNSGVVIDTVNKAAPDRVLFFFSDVAHLLKTIRNCFYKSRLDKNKGKRCMKRRGKKIVWDYIIRLFKEEKHRSVRKSYKLNPVNVFPDSYTCMKVVYAAQVLSRTVAYDLEKKNYPGVSETVNFITEVNDWFDRLNGAHSSVGKKKRNANLDPYVSENDPRFDQLEKFLDYLDDWKAEAYRSQDASLCNSTVNASALNMSGVSEANVSFEPIEDMDDEDDTKAGQRILSHQTLLGIETATRAFIKCVKFLLAEGTPFINARVFSQDPLEQHFSKQRAGGGGSTNPNLSKFLSKNRGIHIQGQLGMKRRKGNSAETETETQVTVEPLPKRKSIRSQKLDM